MGARSARGARRAALGVSVLALGLWLLAGPRGDLGEAEGTVAGIGADTVALAPGRSTLLGGPRQLPIAPALARQLRVGDRVRATLLPGPDGQRRIGRLRFLQRAAPPPEPAADDGSLPLGALLPALTVPGIDGPIALGAGQGTATALAFLFTTCAIPSACPLVAQKLHRLQDAIRGQGRIVTVTLDPERDSLDVLRRYAADHGADPKTWRLGRLPPAALEPLLRQVGVVRARTDTQLLHSLRLVLLDADGRIGWRSDGDGWEVGDVAARLRALGRQPIPGGKS